MTVSVLVTGFSVFPGAETNPTETLMGWFRDRDAGLGPEIDLRVGLLDTAFGTIAEQLCVLGREHRPDVAVHFGLARAARGFRLERLARNRVSVTAPDRHGHRSDRDRACPEGDDLPSGLPLDAIGRELAGAGLPWEFSDDAGDYLCNLCFYLSRGGLAAPLAPRHAGFVHVPHLGDGAAPASPTAGEPRLSRDQLWRGARIIVAQAARAASGQPAAEHG